MNEGTISVQRGVEMLPHDVASIANAASHWLPHNGALIRQNVWVVYIAELAIYFVDPLLKEQSHYLT